MDALEDITTRGNRLMEECCRVFSRQAGNHCSHSSNPFLERLSAGWIKVNVDVAGSSLNRIAGIGDLFQIMSGDGYMVLSVLLAVAT
ncbi:hypothetical protein V6N13_109640 [Hibiscus sabdariffa]